MSKNVSGGQYDSSRRWHHQLNTKREDKSDKEEQSLDASEQVGLTVHKASSSDLLPFRLKDKILIPKQKKCHQHKCGCQRQ